MLFTTDNSEGKKSTCRVIDVQKDYMELDVTASEKTQNYKIRRDQTYCYYDAFWDQMVTERCTMDDLTGVTTRYLQGG